MQEFKTLVLLNKKGGKTMKITEFHSVYISCDDYCANEYRIRVFKNFTKAMAYIKKTFFKRGEYPSYSLEFKNITNLEEGEYEIVSQDSFGGQIIETFDVRDISIKKEFFVVNEKGCVSFIDEFYPTEYILQSS